MQTNTQKRVFYEGGGGGDDYFFIPIQKNYIAFYGNLFKTLV